MIPDKKQCIKILEENNVAANIIEHSKTVAKAAVFLAKELKEAGEKININLVEAAAMLHDLDKLQTLDNGKHGKISFELLSQNYPEIAEIIKKHNFGFILNNQLQTWEEKLVNYTDKRVQEDEIVTLDERFEYGRSRYPDETGRRDEAEKLYKELEKEIFQKINLKPNKLAKAIEQQREIQKKLKAEKRKQKQEVKEEKPEDTPAASEKEEEVAGNEEKTH